MPLPMAIVGLLLALELSLAASDDLRPPPGEGPTLRWVWDGARASVAVEGLDPTNLVKLAGSGRAGEAWTSLLTVGVEPGPQAMLRPIAGRYRVEGSTLRFEPEFPTEWDVPLVARFDPAHLPRPQQGPIQTNRFVLRRPPQSPTTRVTRIDPGGDVLPANLLKFYLHFSGPMSRGEAYRRVRLLDDSGQPLDAPFLEIGEELWNDAGTRLTLLLDPGRIKRGLVPHAEDGPILQAGRSYSLVVDRRWPDAEGRPLVADARHAFRAGPVDEAQPDPLLWKLAPPTATTRDPLTIRLGEALDQALLASALVVHGPDGRPVMGRATGSDDAQSWSFQPDAAWAAGEYRLMVNPELEDLVGNSVARPFEVDIVRPVGDSGRTGPVVRPFTVEGPRPQPEPR